MDLQLFNQERTESATPRRREEARKQGQVFKSMELVGSLTLLATYMVLQGFGPYMAERVLTFSRRLWEQGAQQDWTDAGVRRLILNAVVVVAVASLPVTLVAAVVGTAGNLVQVGFVFTLTSLTPKFERISPAAGLKRVISRRTLIELAKAMIKLTLIGFIAYRTVADDLDRFPGLLGLEVNQVVQFLIGLVSRLLLWVGISTLALAVADYLYQRWEHEESLKMTKQEIREEFKQTEGNPEIRSKIKRKQRELARRRMMHDVKKADVVVTNPTHYAVALGYDQANMGAPRVLAKGQGLVALRIREIASESKVPIVENPPLARALHAVAEIGMEIPRDHYQAVAEVLAYVYQLRRKGYS